MIYLSLLFSIFNCKKILDTSTLDEDSVEEAVIKGLEAEKQVPMQAEIQKQLTQIDLEGDDDTATWFNSL